MPNTTKIAELEAAITRQKAYMRGREISHGRYYTDPYGHKADSAYLTQLLNNLAQEKAGMNDNTEEDKPPMSDLGRSIFEMMTGLGQATAMQAEIDAFFTKRN